MKGYSEIKGIFDSLANNAGKLTPGQIDFIRSLQRYYAREKRLSDKQLKVLNEILNMVKSTV
jgi:hypothetical protein